LDEELRLLSRRITFHGLCFGQSLIPEPLGQEQEAFSGRLYMWRRRR
jgi:hypothetical protein